MSFSSDVKEELIGYEKLALENNALNPCCRFAEEYGFFLCCRNFDTYAMNIRTENRDIAERYARYIKEITGKKPEVTCSKAGNYFASVDTEEDRRLVMSEFGYTGNELNLRLKRESLEADCCKAAILRGAFLSCGTITDPKKDYHMEFVLIYKVLCDDLSELLSEMGFHPKQVVRNGNHILYFKESEAIENLLTLMRATNSAMELMQTEMYKDMRNMVNRRMNFESANFSRSFEAAYKQVEAIRFIKEKRGLTYLPPELRELAELRLENVEYTLSDLSKHLKEPLSKSGVNHRMNKIMALADDLREEES